MKPRVLILIPTPLAFRQFLSEISLKLVEAGFEIHVACQYYQNFLYEEYIHYHFVDISRELNFLKTLKASYQLRKIVDLINPNVIHAHFSSSCLLLAISKTSKFPKCIATLQGALSTSVDLGAKRYLYGFFEFFGMKRMDKCFVLTEDDYVLLRLKLKNLSLQTAKGFGVNLMRFKNFGNFQKSLLRKKFGIDKKDFVIIYIGRLVEFKGFNLALRVFQNVNQNYPNTKMIVCGVEDKIRGLNLDNVEKQIWETNKNIFKTGFTTELEKYLNVADVNFFPSKREGMPVNIMESIAAGVPCITSNYRGCRHAVLHKINGIVVKKYSIDAFTLEIIKLINNRNELESLIEGCNKTRFLYDCNLYLNELVELYS